MAQGRSPRWWSRFQPPPFDPNNPYMPDPGRGSGKRLNKLGRRMAENDPEAYFGRRMMLGGLPYNRGGDDSSFPDFLRAQYANADAAYRQSRLGRPGLTFYKYANQDPTIRYLLDTYGAPPPPGRGGQGAPVGIPEDQLPHGGIGRHPRR